MRKFLIHIAGLFLFLLIAAWLLYKLDPPVEARHLASIKHRQQIVNFGSSHGYNFKYSQAKLKGRNACIGANTLYYDLQNFRYYKEIGLLNHDAVVILPVSYFSFGLEENRTDMLPQKSFIDYYYSYLPPKYIYDYSINKHAQVVLYNVQGNVKSLLFGIKKKSLHAKKPGELTEALRKKHNPFKYPGYEGMAKLRASQHIESFDTLRISSNVDYLKTLIEEVKAEGHQVILVTTPFHEFYNEHFNEAWLEKNYFSIMHGLASSYSIPYLDYSHDLRFSPHRSKFTDSDHLSPVGKEEFNAIFFDDIGAYIQDLSESLPVGGTAH